MRKSFIRSLKMVIWFSFLLGVAYPVLMTCIAQIAMPYKAQGSILINKDKPVGSLLIAQEFKNEKYFSVRPSAVNYNPMPSGGSNLGPTSAILRNLVKSRQKTLAATYHITDLSLIPSELLYASGSGLDPHISINAAYFQVNKVTNARKMNTEQKELLFLLIHKLSKATSLFLSEERYVNVLELNDCLDKL